MKFIKKIILLPLIFLFCSGPENTITPPDDNTWESVPLRTQAQKDIDVEGGEGMQMIFGINYAPSNPGIVYLLSDTSHILAGNEGR